MTGPRNLATSRLLRTISAFYFPKRMRSDELSFCEEPGVIRPSSVVGGMLYVVDVDIVYGPLLRVKFESELLLQRF